MREGREEQNGRTARYHEIAAVLRRHSLGYVADLVGSRRLFPFRRSEAAGVRADASPQRVRHVLEDLGPTFIKLGQLLSTRSDLLPPEYVDELSKLQDSAPPVAVEQIRAVIVRELGAEPEELFASFDNTPLASASIGQAHAATLADGTEVVVKVRRPGAVAQVQEDLEILQNLAARAARTWGIAREFDAPGMAEEFAQTLRAELDYLQEARNAERFADDFEDDPDTMIPRVFWDFTTSRVLTLERMRGANVTDSGALDAGGLDRAAVARRVADIVLQMIFEDRFFHADLHPGNLFIHDDGTIALIDFGMVGEVSEELREQLSMLFVALVRGNADLLGKALVGLSVSGEPVDRELLRGDLTAFLAVYHHRSLGETPFGRMLTELFAILRANRLRLPRQSALLFKVLLLAESLAVRLDPGFRIGVALEPYARRLARERLTASAIAKRLTRASADFGELALDLPGVVRRMVDAADTTGIQVHVRASELEPLIGRAERIGNRLVAGMISAALINGIGGLVTRERRWRSWEGAMMGTGLGVIGTLGAYLAWTSRRRDERRRR
jgi:ubiquinone biosynthesis protein